MVFMSLCQRFSTRGSNKKYFHLLKKKGADRLFELFLYEGDIMLYRFGLALFRMHEQSILMTEGVGEMFALLQNITKITNYKKLIRVCDEK
jgi:ribosome-associated toxin RatA of RatAB toxin-antitoxin module